MQRNHLLISTLLIMGLLAHQTDAQQRPSVSGSADTSDSRTISVKFTEERQGGKLTGCGLSFRQLVHDYADRNGGLVLIEGAVAIVQAHPKLLATWLKVFPSDLVKGKDNKLLARPFKPSYAYATIGNLSTAGKEMIPDACVGEIGYCNGYADDALLAATAGLPQSGRLTVAYQRHKPGIDVSTPIDLTAHSMEEEEPYDAYLRCGYTLLQRFVQ